MFSQALLRLVRIYLLADDDTFFAGLRNARCDVNIGLLADDILHVECAYLTGQDGAAVVATGKLNEFAEVTVSGRARRRGTTNHFHVYLRLLEVGMFRQRSADVIYPAVVERHEFVGLLFTAEHLAQQFHTGHRVLERMQPEIDKHDGDTRGFEGTDDICRLGIRAM